MNKLSLQSLLATIVLTQSTLALAAGDHAAAHAAHQAASGPVELSAPAAAAADLVDGEVRRIDAANKKITLKHGEIKSISMPPMTMVFQVRDPSVLDKLKVGDKVRFAAEKGAGGFVVTQLQPAP
jgi:Cu/Ag efflux protein CusF